MELTERHEWERNGREGLEASAGHALGSDPQSFRSKGTTWQLGEKVSLSASIQTPYSVRVADDASSDTADTVSVVFVRAGVWHLSDHDESFVFRGGDAGFISATRLVLGSNVETSALLVATLPRQTVKEFGGIVPDGVGAFGSGVLRDPSLSFLLGITAAAEREPIPAEQPAAIVGQLMAGLFLEERGYRMDSSGLVLGLWAKAQALIRAQSADRDLNPVLVARQLNVSVRHLQRAFAAHGETVADAIRNRRLEEAVRAIERSSAPFSVIAERAGFSTVAELRRALRSVYGTTPTDLRAAAGARSA